MELFVQESGPGEAPAVVLLHGGGLSGWMWRRCAAMLDGYRCLVPDLPEHGRSRSIAPFAIKDSAERVAELILTRAPGGRAHVVGHSLGAQVLVSLLAAAPQAVDRAVISSALVRRLPLSGLLTWLSLATLHAARRRSFQRLQARAYHIPRADFETYFDDARQVSRVALGRILKESLNFGLPAGLNNASAPSLVLAGQKEPGIVRSSARDLAAAIPNARGFLITGADHAFIFKNPAGFAGILQAWFSGQPLPAKLLTPL